MGQQVKLTDVTFPSNLGLPVLYPDGAMNAGSLYLIDFSNAQGYDNGANIPANGIILPNIAWETAKTMINGGTRSTLSSVATNTLDSASGLVEFTAKRGLHVITSQVNGASSKAFIAYLPELIAKYLFDNEAHTFFVSMWSRYTRVPQTASFDNHVYFLYAYASQAGNYIWDIRVLENRPGNLSVSSTRNLGNRKSDAGAALGTFYRNQGFTGRTGNKDAAYNTTNYKGWKVGPGFGYNSFELNKAPSMVIYRIYIEDLTVSGRSYAQADADDYARYTAAFAPGGKFYGDTFTDPAILP